MFIQNLLGSAVRPIFCYTNIDLIKTMYIVFRRDGSEI